MGAAQQIMVAQSISGGGGDLAAIKTSMVAWYDFHADANDKSGNGHNWTVTGTPSYSGTAITIVNGSNTLSIADGVGALGRVFMPTAAEADASFACWVAANALTGNGEDLMTGKTGRVLLDHFATSVGWAARLGSTTAVGSNSGVPVDDQFYFVVVTYDAATDTTAISVDNGTPATSVITWSAPDNSMLIAGDCQIGWLGFWNRKLTSTEITALFAEGQALAYADLP